MLKVILSVFTSVVFMTCLIVIFYWRDAQFEPDELDLIIYLILFPLVLSFVLLSPYLGLKWLKAHKEKQARAEPTAQRLQDQPDPEMVGHECEWFELNVYAAAVHTALGDNEKIIAKIQNCAGPELDTQLLDERSNPALSYRMQVIDSLIEQEDKAFQLNPIQQRLRLLIEQQLQQHTEVLTVIADHLKHSTMFYDHPLADEYRMHPAWLNPEASTDDEEITMTEPVARLEKINLHIVLAAGFQHVWDESDATVLIEQYFDKLGILPQLMHYEYHYLAFSSSYAQWLQCLAEVNKRTAQVSLFIVADSEISQELMTENQGSVRQYIPAEFAASCLLAEKNLQIENLDATQKILVITKAKDLMQSLAHWNLLDLEQYQQNQPFVSVLDDPADARVVKKLQQHFAASAIDPEHFLYGKSCLGHSQNLSELFGFMLAMQMQPAITRMVYSIGQPMTHVFISSDHLDELN